MQEKSVTSFYDKLTGLDPTLLGDIRRAEESVKWIREATGAELLELAAEDIRVLPPLKVVETMSAMELGNLSRSDLVAMLSPCFEDGTSTAVDLADQVQLRRAFGDPRSVTQWVTDKIMKTVENFPMDAADLRVGRNPGDVLDPFILAANFELLSEGSLEKSIEHTISHKVLMKLEDLVGHLHEQVLSFVRGNFRIPEPSGKTRADKEKLDRMHNPFPGADVGQVPWDGVAGPIRLFQIKSKTGSAKGGDGKRLGDQLRSLVEEYDAETFYAAIVGNTLRGHRSKGAVLRASPATRVLVGKASLDELTQSSEGGELLLRVYQRAFKKAAIESKFDFAAVSLSVSAQFKSDADEQGVDFLTAWLHEAIGFNGESQDSGAEPQGSGEDWTRIDTL